MQSGTVFVSAPGSEAVYAFRRTGTEWTQTAKLTVIKDSRGFGLSLSATTDTLLVGDLEGSSSAAHIFQRADGEWNHTATLAPEDADAEPRFGMAVELVEGSAVVGAPYAVGPAETRTGAAYVFDRTETGWTQREKLFPADGEDGDGFGTSLVAEDGTFLVGAPGIPSSERNTGGSVYAFRRMEDAWAQTAQLTTNVPDLLPSFGSSVAVAGDTVLIGAPNAERSDADAAGVIYVVERSGAEWQLTEELTPSDTDAGDGFGVTAEVAGDTALVGATRLGSTGSVYVFDRSGGTWSQRTELVPEYPAVNGGFGAATAMDGETGVIGAPSVGEDDAGAAFVADLTE
jgi:hypothetical protein